MTRERKCRGCGYPDAATVDSPTLSPEAAAELVGFLKENLRIDVEFEAYHYGRENRLTVTVKIDDEVITESTCRVEPTTSDGY